jgi:two-component system nitrogen regulation sensor histidine kinase NtrY
LTRSVILIFPNHSVTAILVNHLLISAQLLHKFQKTRAEKEAHFRYLQTVVQHVGIGLISYLPDGRIGLINSAAKKIFSIPHLNNLDELQKIDPQIPKAIKKVKPGEKTLLKLMLNNDQIQLAVSATQFQIQEKNYTLISLQNIGQELEENELESWQKLIRVLTHEIMNSVTPISSLAGTIHNILTSDITSTHTQSDELDDVKSALETIQKRSDGLLNFVNTYRKLTKLPRPDFKIFKISHLFSQISQLMQPRVDEKHIKFNASVHPESMELTADSDMIEQVLINLLINAIQAVENNKDAEINLKAWIDGYGKITIEVTDNGPGIPDDVVDKIFIPFFTTKKEGSGIGLSLSKQIMRLHNGAISVNSVPGKRTVFTLHF